MALAGALLLAPAAALAAQSSSQFRVTANLQDKATAPTSVFCRTDSMPGSFGATVTVVCATGIVVDISPPHSGVPWAGTHGGAYRYATQVNWAGQVVGTVDIYSGLGTITSWRVVNLVDRVYVEMTLNW